MVELQLWMMLCWQSAGERVRAALADHNDEDRGEVTATTAIIVLLVIAAIAAGGIIAAKITGNANNVPSP